MNYTTFANILTSISPSQEDYLKLGVSKEYALKASNNFIAIPKTNDQAITTQNVGLVDFIENFDCDKMQIGLISFLSKVNENSEYYIVGNVEADILAVSKVTLEVVVLDHDDESWVIWPCAQNSDFFFDAVFEFAKSISNQVKDRSSIRHEMNAYLISICTEKAGGGKYEAFYEMLIDS